MTLTAGTRPRPSRPRPPARAGARAASLWLAPRPRAESARQSVPSAAAGRRAAANLARRSGGRRCPRASREEARSPDPRSAMAPIGLKAVVGESKWREPVLPSGGAAAAREPVPHLAAAPGLVPGRPPTRSGAPGSGHSVAALSGGKSPPPLRPGALLQLRPSVSLTSTTRSFLRLLPLRAIPPPSPLISSTSLPRSPLTPPASPFPLHPGPHPVPLRPAFVPQPTALLQRSITPCTPIDSSLGHLTPTSLSPSKLSLSPDSTPFSVSTASLFPTLPRES